MLDVKVTGVPTFTGSGTAKQEADNVWDEDWADWFAEAGLIMEFKITCAVLCSAVFVIGIPIVVTGRPPIIEASEKYSRESELRAGGILELQRVIDSLGITVTE